MRDAAPSISLSWGTWLLILLLELATPAAVVLGTLYGVPLLLGASQRTPGQAWRFLLLCCASTLLNLLVPLPVDLNASTVVIDRLLVCLGLVITTALLVNNQSLQRRHTALEVDLARAQLRGDVIATLAHDIKTPVLGTIASLSLLEAGPAVDAIRDSQRRCLRLIDDLLQVFRAEQDGLRLQPQLCHWPTILQETLQSVGPIAAQRHIQLLIRQEPTVAMSVVADPVLLRRLLENLLLNAVNHSPRSERVWLQLSQEDSVWLVVVRDNGPGFPAGELPRLFERFAQLADGSMGSGLGLYLCRLITEAHGGSITASNSPGGGAKVVVRLPRSRSQPCVCS